MNAGEQLGEGERLGEIVVGSRVESGHPIGQRVARGEHEDGRVDTSGAQIATDGDAVLPGQEPVEDDGIVGVDGDQLVALVAVVGDVDDESFLAQPLAEKPGGLLVVFDQQDPHGSAPTIPSDPSLRAAPCPSTFRISSARSRQHGPDAHERSRTGRGPRGQRWSSGWSSDPWWRSSAEAQAPVTRLTLDEAVRLATRDNPGLRAKQLEVRATRANEVTAALRPNPVSGVQCRATGRAKLSRHGCHSAVHHLGQPAHRDRGQAPAPRRQCPGRHQRERLRAGGPATAGGGPGQEVVHRHPVGPGDAGPRARQPGATSTRSSASRPSGPKRGTSPSWS